MGRVVRAALAVLAVLCWSAAVAAADVPFDAPAHAVRELVGERTAASRTWEMPSGLRVTKIAPEPVQWRDDQGEWHEYDVSLVAGGDGWLARPGKLRIDLPAQLGGSDDAVVRVANDAGDAVSIAVLGDLSRGAVSRDVASFAGVARGVDLRLRALPTGLKEDVELESATAVRDLRYRIAVSSDDLVVESDHVGGLRVVRGEKPVFVIPAPGMVDAKGASGVGSRFELRRDGDRSWVVSLALDEKWLDDADRAWPVVVDPTVNTFSASSTLDCQVTIIKYFSGSTVGPSYQGCNTYPSNPIGILYDNPSYYTYRADLLRFNTLTLVQSDAIDSAELQLYQLSHSYSRALNVYAVTRDWDATTPPWSTSANWADQAPATVIAPVADGAFSTDLTTLVDEWRRWQATSGVEGVQNRGILLSMQGAPMTNLSCSDCDQPTVYRGAFPDDAPSSLLSSATASAPTPILQVRSWPAAPAGNAVISPGEGDLTGKRVRLQARALASSVGTVRFQYIAGSQRTWTDVPLAALTTPTRGSVSSVDIPVSGPTGDRRSDLVVWDLSAMPGGDVDGPVHVRAWLESTIRGDGGMTDQVNFRLDRRGIDGAPSVEIGPGEVNLLSGEFSMSQTDASIGGFLQDLTLTRTYRSRGVAVRNADMFGSGWEASVQADGGDLPYKGIYDYSEVRDVAVDRQVLDPSTWNWELFFETFDFEALSPDVETVQDTERFHYEYAVVEASDGTKMTFTQVTDSGGNVTDWTPDDDHPGYAIRREATGTAGILRYTLTDPGGNVAVFVSEAASSPNARLSTFQQPGSTRSLSYTYEASGTRQRLKTVTAPAPAGTATRSLTFNWSNVGSPAVPHVTSVDFRDGYGTTITVASYSYDTNARLIQETDPRIAGGVRITRYAYDGPGRLFQITPSGEATWTLSYASMAGDSGPRLRSVSRPHPDGGTATNTIAYGVPLSGTGAPYDMSTAATATWGQTDDLPWEAVAIWPEDTVPNFRVPDYSKATVHYLDLDGLEANVARPGGAISTSWHDANGNVVRELSGQGRAVALAAGAGSASVAVDRSTLYQYANNGVDLLATREPVTQITLSDGRVVTGRRVRSTSYDEGAPAGGPYHLSTSEWRAVEPTSGGQVDVREQVRYDYSANGGMSGWSARHATKTIVDPGGRALTSYSILHPDYRLVEETRTPAAPAGGNTPDDQWYQYYGITPSTRVPGAIRNATCSLSDVTHIPGQLCERSEATTLDASIPRRLYTYDAHGNVTSIDETRSLVLISGSDHRRTSYGFDGAEQLVSNTVTDGTGTATPVVTYSYAPDTGKPTQASSANGTIRRTFDSNGRLSQYTDGAGTVTSYRYDLRGREASTTVDGLTTSYSYDDRDNTTSVTDAGIGSSITATYDLDDNLAAETLPNGLVATETYDETGRPNLLSWVKTSGCSSNCTWARSEILNRDADGRITIQRTANTQETLTYDTVGRLTQDDAVRLSDNRCVRRTYSYDGGGAGDSNRTGSSAWTSAPGAACGTGTPTTRTLTYDSADRITASGWTWDLFGRATDVPAADSGGSSALTAAYYTNDRARQLTLDGRTHTYTRDPLDRTMTTISAGASKPRLASTYRYGDDTDEPVKTTISDGTISRDIEGPSSQILANDTNGTITYQLRDLQGSIVGTAPATGTPTATTEYDPFGIVTTPAPNVIDWTKGLPANGWLGSYQRTTQFGQTSADAAGPIEMGARVYLPKVGRFLQVDPIDGGSANSYDYAAQDPVDASDLSGTMCGGCMDLVNLTQKVLGFVTKPANAVINRCFDGFKSGLVASAIAGLSDRKQRTRLARAGRTIRDFGPQARGLWAIKRKAAIRYVAKVAMEVERDSLIGTATSCVLGDW